MAEVIRFTDRQVYAETLQDMHEQRYDVFVNRMGWDIPGIEPNYDKDAFDTDETLYLIERHTITGEVVASCRLNPTTSPYMLSDVFRQYCQFEDLPETPKVWELSRLVYDWKRLTRAELTALRPRFRLAILECCIREGIEAIAWLSTLQVYNNTLGVWPTRPLGAPMPYVRDGDAYVAAISQMRPAELITMRETLEQVAPAK
ncbi:MAG: acyl-homoserine-lactone synthase [Pseudomonadota bacterium]